MNIKSLQLTFFFSSILICGVAVLLMSISNKEVTYSNIVIKAEEANLDHEKKELFIKEKTLIKNIPINVPLINQHPELVRGCEVTSLAMLLQFYGIEVDKLTLAKEVKKVPYIKNGIYGNPNDGFVGNMYTYDQLGYGVFDRPIEELANEFLPGQVQNISGANFDVVKKHLLRDIPVWVIVTSTYDEVPSIEWELWDTNSGEISITKRQHSVVLTGFDHQNVYFNDPLALERNSSAPIEEFIAGWNQFGNKAIIINFQNNNNLVKKDI